MSSSATFDLIEQERLRIADLAEGWSADQWDVPSLAAGWRVREVMAHLTMPFAVSLPRMVVGLARNRGSFDRFADRWARAAAADTAPEVFAADLRANATSRFTPPGAGPEAPLTDVIVHGLDMRIPLGLPTSELARAALETTLGFLATPAGRRIGVAPDVFATRRFEATDVDWSHGTGPTHRAPATDLIAHLCRSQPLPGGEVG